MKQENKTQYYLYILECSNGSYYTGITTDPKRRWQEHIEGKGAKYTKAFPPKEMLALWRINESRARAQQLEAKLKALLRSEKEKLVKDPKQLAIYLSTENEPTTDSLWFDQDLLEHCR